MFTVEQISRFYRIEAIDYMREGGGLLVGAGTGLMLAVMDQVPSLRYCIDTDTMRADEWKHLANWLTLMERSCDYVASCGWWSRADNGLKLAEATRVLTRPAVYYGALERPSDWAHCEIFDSLGQFVSALRAKQEKKRDAEETSRFLIQKGYISQMPSIGEFLRSPVELCGCGSLQCACLSDRS